VEVTVLSKEFRFAVGIRNVKSRVSLEEKARRLEGLGFDVLHVPDHLGAPAPFPALTAIAQATTTARVGTYVLNACFYKPALLARDVAGLDLLSEGRFDAGLGAGYVKDEFDAAELPFPGARARVEYLEHVTTYLKEHLPSVPVLIAGAGDRLLTVAAQHADIIGLTGASPRSTGDPLAERVDFVRNAAGERFTSLELNLAITAVSPADGSPPDLSMTRRYVTELSDQELLALPTVLNGSTQTIADKLRAFRDTYGVTSFTVQENHADSFAKVIAELR
jgi:probable F420-dependent oxidoreductase